METSAFASAAPRGHGRCITSSKPIPLVLSMLRRFTDVGIRDSTVLTLPAHWPSYGGGTGNGGQAALRLQVRLSLCKAAPMLRPRELHLVNVLYAVGQVVALLR